MSDCIPESELVEETRTPGRACGLLVQCTSFSLWLVGGEGGGRDAVRVAPVGSRSKFAPVRVFRRRGGSSEFSDPIFIVRA